MLANDSNEGKNQSEFFLVIRPHQAVAELMAECPSCGAITSFVLELAWQLNVVSCSECNRATRLDEYEVKGFRERLADAITRVNALLGSHQSERRVTACRGIWNRCRWTRISIRLRSIPK